MMHAPPFRRITPVSNTGGGDSIPQPSALPSLTSTLLHTNSSFTFPSLLIHSWKETQYIDKYKRNLFLFHIALSIGNKLWVLNQNDSLAQFAINLGIHEFHRCIILFFYLFIRWLVSSWMWCGILWCIPTFQKVQRFLNVKADGIYGNQCVGKVEGFHWRIYCTPLLSQLYSVRRIFFFLWRCSPTRAMASSFLRFLDHAQRRITVGRTPLDEWSARRRDLHLTTHDNYNRQTSMTPVGFEPTISAGERPQTYALDRVATGTGYIFFYISNLFL